MSLANEDYVRLQAEEAGEWEGGWATQMIAAFMEAVQDLPKSAKIIDIGCGEGRGVYEMQNLGYTNVIGFELVPEKVSAAQARGLNVVCGDVHELATVIQDPADFGFMSHAIEHTLDPALAIQQIQERCAHGLIICPIETEAPKPNARTPHTSPFYSPTEWIALCNRQGRWLRHEKRWRMGPEVWSWF